MTGPIHQNEISSWGCKSAVRFLKFKMEIYFTEIGLILNFTFVALDPPFSNLKDLITNS